MAVTVASKIPFSELAGLLEKISKKQGAENKRKLLCEFIEEWRKFYIETHKEQPNPDDSFHPIMRLLLPQMDRERSAYGIKENMLARLYIDVLGLGKDSTDAQKMMNYRNPKNNKDTTGDFAMVTYFILTNRCPAKSDVMIEKVNECLDNIAINNAAKNKDEVKKNILFLLRNMTALEQKWLIRIILKDLKVGISHKAVFKSYHPDAEELHDVCASLLKVCMQLRDPQVRMHEIEITLSSPFRPMLGEGAAPQEVEKLMERRPYFIETKYDGERIQMHKDGNDYKFFSRQSHDFSDSFGPTKHSGTFTPNAHTCFKPHVKNAILDGEMMGMGNDGIFITKGQSFDVKNMDLGTSHPCYGAFDILLLNDKVLSNLPLKERKNILRSAINPIDKWVFISEEKEARTQEDCVEALNEAISGREEGIMVKNPESVYKPNTRKGGWWKIKPEYVKGLMDELDVLVVGGNFGSGARRNVLSHFVCAVAVPAPPGERPTEFHSFCRVGSGYTHEELLEFNRKLAPHWKTYSKKNPPKSVKFIGGSKERPEVWIEPENSLIIQIKATEIVSSDVFVTGCTLRFPRLEMFRDDKPWYDCMTTTMLEDLRQKSDGKLAGRFVEVDDNDSPEKKRRRVLTRPARPTVATQFQATDTSDVTKTSELFKDKEICVINGSGSLPKADLEKRIVEYGGTVVQHPGPGTFCVLCDKIVFRVKNIMSKDLYDVVKIDWFQRCTKSSRLLPWKPSDLHHASKTTQERFASEYDQYGDSFTEFTTKDQLLTIFEKVDEKHIDTASPEDIGLFENEYFPDESPNGLFRIFKFYVDRYSNPGDILSKIVSSPLELTELDICSHGGMVVTEMTDHVTHVILTSRDLSRVPMYRDTCKERRYKFHLVLSEWVDICIEKSRLINERAFEPPAV